jgi:beta-glucanase (GH16 family)
MKQMNIANIFVIVSLAIASLGCTEKDPTPPSAPKTFVEDKGWEFETTPVWTDEFDNNGKPSTSKWVHEVGGGGWGNNELQYYTNQNNSQIANGVLTITARKEDFENRKYTSTRMISRNVGDFLYGRVVSRIKLPKGRGTWPAFWMLPTDSEYGVWPRSGEIDIMEHVGYRPGEVHASVHTEAYNHSINTQKTNKTMVPTFDSEFHDYRVDWTPYSIKGFVDGVQYFEFVNSNTGSKAWPFNKRFFIILNIAVGGNWGGAQGVDDSIFPATMEVDYVRVYKMIEK